MVLIFISSGRGASDLSTPILQVYTTPMIPPSTKNKRPLFGQGIQIFGQIISMTVNKKSCGVRPLFMRLPHLS